MYFNHSKQFLIDLINSSRPSNPISLDSNLKEFNRFAISSNVITIFKDTLSPLSNDNSKVIFIGSNNSASFDNLDFELASL